MFRAVFFGISLSVNLFTKIFDLLLILVLAYGVYSLGNYFGRNDGYYEGLIAGYDLYWKHAYEHLRDSLASASQFD